MAQLSLFQEKQKLSFNTRYFLKNAGNMPGYMTIHQRINFRNDWFKLHGRVASANYYIIRSRKVWCRHQVGYLANL
jgi:hypothetical protein